VVDNGRRGCGGSSGLSESELKSQVDGICKKHNEVITAAASSARGRQSPESVVVDATYQYLVMRAGMVGGPARAPAARCSRRRGMAQGYVDREFDRPARTQLVTSETAERRRLVVRMQEIVALDLRAPALSLHSLNRLRKRAFDRWYYTPGGFATGLPGVLNKQVLVTGTQRGTAVRAVS